MDESGRLVPVSAFSLIHYLVSHCREKKIKVNVKAACRWYGVSSSGYYSWLKSQKEEPVSLSKTARVELSMRIVELIKFHSHIPSHRRIKSDLNARWGMRVSRRTISKVMRQMGLISSRHFKNTRRIRDPYKGQATHDHPACALKDEVLQWFDREQPRLILLTDITYIHYGDGKIAYLVVFKDGCTKEILGWNLKDRMDVTLIKEAYDAMLQAHKEIRPSRMEVYIHSDQGSQYVSTTFQKLLKDDGFIQSMSRRGNSQDNAPAESFFATLKAEAAPMKRCRDLKTLKEMVRGYIHHYNHDRGQYGLGWLSPVNYYAYKMTGIYELPSYYGVSSEELMSWKEELEQAEARKQKKARADRKRNQEQRKNMKDISNVSDQIERDRIYASKVRSQLISTIKKAEKRLKEITELIRVIDVADAFVAAASEEVREELRRYKNWSRYPEMNYYKDYGKTLDLQGIYPNYIYTY